MQQITKSDYRDIRTSSMFQFPAAYVYCDVTASHELSISAAALVRVPQKKTAASEFGLGPEPFQTSASLLGVTIQHVGVYM